jgi:hypothetical protein
LLFSVALNAEKIISLNKLMLFIRQPFYFT